MGIILWVVFGALVGWVVSMMMKTQDGTMMNVVVGIVGALIGGFAWSMIRGTSSTAFDLASLIVAIVAAVVLLWIVKMFKK